LVAVQSGSQQVVVSAHKFSLAESIAWQADSSASGIISAEAVRTRFLRVGRQPPEPALLSGNTVLLALSERMADESAEANYNAITD
jgi:hypothetical protein